MHCNLRGAGARHRASRSPLQLRCPLHTKLKSVNIHFWLIIVLLVIFILRYILRCDHDLDP